MKTLMTALMLAVLTSTTLSAHCDSLDGPVVTAARQALTSGDVNLVLPWVRPADETAIRQAFARTVSVRGVNPEAKELADTWFFETLVRIHRAAEGAPYEGLKPAGSNFSPALAIADKAVETGNVEKLEQALMGEAMKQLHTRFHRVAEARGYVPSDVKAGREYVAAYVDFIHFAERLHDAIAAGSEHSTGHGH